MRQVQRLIWRLCPARTRSARFRLAPRSMLPTARVWMRRPASWRRTRAVAAIAPHCLQPSQPEPQAAGVEQPRCRLVRRGEIGEHLRQRLPRQDAAGPAVLREGWPPGRHETRRLGQRLGAQHNSPALQRGDAPIGPGHGTAAQERVSRTTGASRPRVRSTTADQLLPTRKFSLRSLGDDAQIPATSASLAETAKDASTRRAKSGLSGAGHSSHTCMPPA